MWTEKSGDAYVAIRCLGGQSKVSLHGSGDWRYGYTREYWDRPDTPYAIRDFVQFRDLDPALASAPDRIIRQWRRPDPDEHGYIVAIRLAVPAMSCTTLPVPTTKNKRIEYVLVPADPNLMVTFTVVISPRDLRVGYPKPMGGLDSTLVGQLPLGDSATLWVVAHTGPLLQTVVEAAIKDLHRSFFARRLVARTCSKTLFGIA